MLLVDDAAQLTAGHTSHRLTAGLALSLVAHALGVLAVTPASPRYVAPMPLQVKLQPVEAPQPAGEMSSELPAELPAAAPPEAPPLHDMPPVTAATPQPPAIAAQPLDGYFTVHDLDLRAELINMVDLVYPVKAYEMRLPGTVIVRMFINEDGVVDGAAVLEATPPGVFEEAALEATRALKFRPAQKHGRNVKSQKTIEVTFDPYESIRPR